MSKDKLGRQGDQGGSVVSLAEFRKKREGEEIPGETKAKAEKEGGGEAVDHGGEGHACFVCDIAQKGIPLDEAMKRVQELESKKAAGGFNPKTLNDRINDLRQEDIEALVGRTLGLTAEFAKSHPTYTMALIKVLREKVKFAIGKFKEDLGKTGKKIPKNN